MSEGASLLLTDLTTLFCHSTFIVFLVAVQSNTLFVSATALYGIVDLLSGQTQVVKTETA